MSVEYLKRMDSGIFPVCPRLQASDRELLWRGEKVETQSPEYSPEILSLLLLLRKDSK